jgi:hypothetical protein
MTKMTGPGAVATLGIDLGKNVSSLVGMDADGRVVLRRRVRRATLFDLADSCRLARWRWRRAAALTISGASSLRAGTRSA